MKQSIAFLSAGLVSASAANAFIGGQLFYTGGPVNVEFIGQTASLDSLLYYYPEYPSLANAQFLFHNHLNAPGDTAALSLPLGLPVGAELVFGIEVPGDSTTYFSGPAARNPDGVAHADVITVDAVNNIYDVGFEDLANGGDMDYDDNVFRFTGATPAPGALPLLALAGMVAGRRRRS